MKIILLFFSLLPLTATGDMDAITRAIATGQIAMLEQYLDSTVEISLPGQEDIYEKEKAAAVLKDFFEHCAPKAFNEVHHGASKGNDSLYYIGTLYTSAGNYRWYMFIRIENTKLLIQEIRIDKA
jgi:hypothetical protein